MTSEQASDTADDLQQARRFLEVVHGDHLRTAHLPDADTQSHVQQAEGLRVALAVIEQVEHDEWDAESVEAALDEVAGDDSRIDAAQLRDLSQTARSESGRVDDHPVIERTAVPVRPRSYVQLLRDYLGI